MADVLNVVVLDDNEADCERVSLLLEQIDAWTLQVETFDSVPDCLEYLAAHEGALLILDYRLDPESGLDILRKLRDQDDRRPIILLTGVGNERMAAEVGLAGADEYLMKNELDAESLRRGIESARQRYQLRLQRAMLAAQHQEAQKMEAIGVLAGGLAHDFNNMLASIMGFAELASMKYKRGQEINRELDFVRRGCRQMADLVQQLVRFSTRNEPDMVQLNIGDVIQDTVTVLKHSISKSIKIELDLPPDGMQATANAGMLQQTLLNICVNAADAMPEGGTLRFAVNRFKADKRFLVAHPDLEPGEYVGISVQDTGSGIPEDTLPRIFEPFFTTKPLSSNKGTGLGLATVWHNVKTHNGDIEATSKVGEGTTFTLYLPVSLRANATTAEVTAADAPESGCNDLLLVDDEELVLEMAQALLEEMGYAVCVANSGQNALNQFRDQHQRLAAVILDISMPDMDGRDVFRRMQAIDPAVPVLFATGHDTSSLGEELKEMGATAIIQKPFIYGELSQKIRLAIDSK